jgi:hypothetical protein
LRDSLPRRNAELALLVGAVALLMQGCAHVRPAEPLPTAWHELAGGAPPFAALYRLDCCHLTNLVATVRDDGEHMRVTVAAPPTGAVLDAWLTTAGGLLTRNGGRCVEALPPGELPLAGGRRIPLDIEVAGLVLAGRVAAGAIPLAGAPGWVSSRHGAFELAWQIAGSPARCVSFEMRRNGAHHVVIHGSLADHHGRVPGRLVLEVGGERISLELEEWRPGVSLAIPSWLDARPCGGRG